MYRSERLSKFTGPFADICREYIHKNRILGYKYNINETYLRQFDNFCIGRVKSGDPITKQLFEAWTQKRPYESEASHQLRYEVLSRFCRDLLDTGKEVYVGFFPTRHNRTDRGFAPYIFTKEEIGRFFTAADQTKPSRHSPSLHMVLPVLFRMLYACGLRLSEALNLLICDVNLEQGYIAIRDTKFDKSRKVPLSTSMLSVCKRYAQRMDYVFKETEFFFPSPDNGQYAECTVYSRYRDILFAAGISHNGRGKGPRLHDFRHTFAVHSLRKLASEGQDLYVTLPILSGYMGHKSLDATQCYLRLTPEVYPDVTENFEKCFGAVFPEVKT